jgi:enoyl-CoA hydratase/carnithine racemase
MITALNGSVFRHPELPLASDIVLASADAVIQDSSHFIVGLVPADGGHLLLPLIMGLTRARYFLLTGQELSAQQAHEFGVVNEVLPAADVLPRAWQVARTMIKQRPLVLRNTRAAFAHPMRQLIAAGQPLGLMLEGMASIDAAQQPGFEGYVIGGPTA